MSIMYIYFKTLDASDTIKRLNRDLDRLKKDMDDSGIKLNRIENILNRIRQQQGIKIQWNILEIVGDVQ